MGNMTCSVCGRGTRIPCTCMNGRITCNFQMGTADPTCATPDAGPPRDGGLVRDGGFTIQRCAAGVMNGGMCPANSAPCALTACTNGSHMVCRCNNGTWACASTMFGC
jgi:hypothetical protein